MIIPILSRSVKHNGPISGTFAALLARAGIVKETWQLMSPRRSAYGLWPADGTSLNSMVAPCLSHLTNISWAYHPEFCLSFLRNRNDKAVLILTSAQMEMSAASDIAGDHCCRATSKTYEAAEETHWIHMGVSMAMGVPPNGRFIVVENPT